MPDEPTTPIEPVEDVVGVEAVDPESADEGLIVDTEESTRSEREISQESTVEPVVEDPIVEPVVIVPEPTSEPVVISEPVVVVPTESAPEPIVEAPVSEPVIIPEPASEPTPPPVTYNLPPVIAPPIEPKLDSFHINMARARELLVKARYVIQLNKKKKIDKIMGLFLKKTKVTNREVRDLLRLSHDMVNVYMNVLIKEGKIKREGKSSATHYTKV